MTGFATSASRARRALAVTGPWPAARTGRAIGALVTTAALAVWTLTSEPLLAGVFLPLVLVAASVIASAVLAARPALLPLGIGLLAVAAGLTVLVADAGAGTAALAGAALVCTTELARWANQRRASPTADEATSRRRWLHLAVVIGVGCGLGVAVTATAPGGFGTLRGSLVAGGFAVVIVVGAVTLAARARS